jgi:NADH dehydrogenase
MTIRVATRSPERATPLLPMGHVGQIVIVRAEVTNSAARERFVAGCEFLVNLVGTLHERQKGDFARLQGELPGALGETAALQGVEAVTHISAIGADPDSPSAYGRTKAEGEERLRAAFPGATILRPSIVFGPEDGFFNRFAAMSRYLPALPLIGGGRTRLQPVYVGDVAEAVLRTFEVPDLRGRTYELGGPRTYSFKELMEYLLGLLGRRRMLLDLPFGAASWQARLLELLPEPPLTRDQVEMLKRDNVVAPGALTLEDLGVTPTPLELIVPHYVRQFARYGVRMPVR